MATPAQIAANIANAQKSTGPRTEAGKNTCRTNAVTHGLCSFITCLDDEDTKEVDALRTDLIEEHDPQGPTEQILVHKMAENFWLTKRASYYLAVHTMYNEGRDADDGGRNQTNRPLSPLLLERRPRLQQKSPRPP